MSAECSNCGFDITYPVGTVVVLADTPWPQGVCENCRLNDRVQELENACRYLAGYDVAGWEAHMRDDEVLAKVGLAGAMEGRFQ